MSSLSVYVLVMEGKSNAINFIVIIVVLIVIVIAIVVVIIIIIKSSNRLKVSEENS